MLDTQQAATVIGGYGVGVCIVMFSGQELKQSNNKRVCGRVGVGGGSLIPSSSPRALRSHTCGAYVWRSKRNRPGPPLMKRLNVVCLGPLSSIKDVIKGKLTNV